MNTCTLEYQALMLHEYMYFGTSGLDASSFKEQGHYGRFSLVKGTSMQGFKPVCKRVPNLGASFQTRCPNRSLAIH